MRSDDNAGAPAHTETLSHAVLDALPVAAVVVDGNGRIAAANAALGALLGVPPGDPLDTDALAAVLSPLACAGGTARAFAAVTHPAHDLTLHRVDGTPVAVSVLVGTPHGGTGLVCVITPADDAAHSPDALTRHSASGVCLSASPGTDAVFGRTPHVMRGVDVVALAHPDDREALAGMFARVAAGAQESVTFRALRPDDTWGWVDTAAAPAPGGTAVCASRDATLRMAAESRAWARAERADRESAEQEALRRVAMAIAIESDAAAALEMVADEASRLTGSDVGMVVQFQDDGSGVVAAVGGASPAAVGTAIDLGDDAVLRRLIDGGTTVRGRSAHIGALHGDSEPTWVVAAPVRVDHALWGAVLATGRQGRTVPTGTEARLDRFAELTSVATVAAETRMRLARQATTDPLTGLANHRIFHERLRDEIARARRCRRPLSLAVVDLDHFKRFNDTYGHQAGDQVLAKVAEILSGTARRSELVARVGGEEFAWLLPECTATTAAQAVERARAMIAAEPVWGQERLTLSAGVCDLSQARDGDELYQSADAALYWSKTNGRNQLCVYSPAVIDAMSPEERTRRMEQDRTLAALRALARAVDAKDTATGRHSVRVAAMAQRLAVVRGWPRERAQRLHDAGLLHDIGKLGVPDAILTRPARLNDDERAAVVGHAALGAEIASDVLDAEQCDWIRGHHEHWDGTGYPRGLAGDAIPEGSRILAVAEAWDVITSARPYGEAMGDDAAAAELRHGAGTQFWPPAVNALVRVVYGPSPASAAA